MADRIAAALGPIQETLLIPLYGRASLTRQGSRLIDDPAAVEMVERIDYDFSRFDGTMSLIGSVLRTRIFDHWIARWLAEHPTGTIVEIGAGLNTRYERLDNGTARWFELDLPDAMDLRRRFFADTERRTMIAGSVTDDGWHEQVLATGGPWFLAAEAVLIYLPEPVVESVFASLATSFPGASTAFDTWGSWMRDHQDEHDTIGSFEARFEWFCDDVAAMFAAAGAPADVVEQCTFLDAPPEVLELLPADMLAMLPALADDPQMNAYRQQLATFRPAAT